MIFDQPFSKMYNYTFNMSLGSAQKSYMKKRVYELLDRGIDAQKNYEITDRHTDPTAIVTNFVIECGSSVEAIKMFRMLHDDGAKASVSLFYALRSVGYHVRNEFIKWSLAYGGDPNYVHPKIPFPYNIWYNAMSCLNYCLNSDTSACTIRLILEADANVNRNDWIPVYGILLYMDALNLSVNHLDRVEVDKTCVVTMIIET